MRYFDLTCRWASKLLVEQRGRHLSLREQISVAMHLRVCLMCRRYNKQLDIMDQAVVGWKSYREGPEPNNRVD